MLFCTKCGKLIFLINPSPLEKNKLTCSCGNVFEINEEKLVLNEKLKEKEEKIEIVKDENMLAVHTNICKKCGYDKAELIEVGVMYGDEDGIIRYKCGKCGYVEQLAAKGI